MLKGRGELLPGGKKMGVLSIAYIKKNQWHQFRSRTACRILEFQFGDDVKESDIERV
jgi:hypothetical protein